MSTQREVCPSRYSKNENTVIVKYRPLVNGYWPCLRHENYFQRNQPEKGGIRYDPTNKATLPGISDPSSD